MWSKVICVRCPRSCVINVLVEEGAVKSIEGYGCGLGLEYAKEEVSSPKRTVCSTVKIVGGKYPRLPVRTSVPVPKNKIRNVIRALHGITVKAPVKRGDIILSNVADTGADIVAEMDVNEEGNH
jgi:CxxC motif-containing protein